MLKGIDVHLGRDLEELSSLKMYRFSSNIRLTLLYFIFYSLSNSVKFAEKYKWSSLKTVQTKHMVIQRNKSRKYKTYFARECLPEVV